MVDLQMGTVVYTAVVLSGKSRVIDHMNMHSADCQEDLNIFGHHVWDLPIAVLTPQFFQVR